MSDEADNLPPRELFDEEFAASLIGKTLLIGITNLDHHRRLVKRWQFFGTVTVADRRKGICVQREEDGAEMWFPPDTRGIEAASPGEYQNRTTGEVVTDPDYTASWVWTEDPPVA